MELGNFPQYLDALERTPRVMDLGTQIGHGALRAFVMGERGAANESATDADIEAMAAHVEESIRAGALGFSTSRTPIHRSKSGELVPGTCRAKRTFAIGDAVQRAGGGVFQFAPEHIRLASDEWPWMRELSRRSPDVTISVNLNQADEKPDIWRDVLTLLDTAHDDNLNIVCQVAGRSIGILMCLEGTLHPLLFHPAYTEVSHLSITERLKALRDPTRRERIITEIPNDAGFLTQWFSSACTRCSPSRAPILITSHLAMRALMLSPLNDVFQRWK